MKRRVYIGIGIGTLVLAAFVSSAVVGRMLGPGVLHPMVRPLTLESAQASEGQLRAVGATPENLFVTAPDGVSLRGWKVRPASPNGDWVLLFHGVSDNRTGMTGQAKLLLSHGYGVVMMDSRAHGESGGGMATYGWLERRDTRAVVDALETQERPYHLFALGSSMGAAIALQSASVEPRIAGAVAESSFSSLREVSYDYAGLHWSPWLGKTLFRPGTWTLISSAEKEGGFSVDEVSPETSVSSRPFPVLLICDGSDYTIPCRHTLRIFGAATGQKEVWEVPRAAHASAIGAEPGEYKRRVIGFFDRLRGATAARPN
jgi:uncharacterized protein